MAKRYLPPGFRFHPTDIELVKYYLKRKVMGKKLHVDAIAEVDIYKFAPWDLPDKSYLRSRDLKWYFFCPREKKYASGARLNRTTEFGFWKATGRDRPVLYDNEVAGMIKTLIFHSGRAPKGERTDWVMHEYRLEDKSLAMKEVVQDAYVLCIIFKKNGIGPRNGAQYGAPFREEDWSDDDEIDYIEAISKACLPVEELPEPTNQTNTIATSSHVPQDICIEPLSGPRVSEALASAVQPLITNGNGLAQWEVPQFPNDNDVLSMLESFLDDENFVFNQNEKTADANHVGNAELQHLLEGNDIFSGLVDTVYSDGIGKDEAILKDMDALVENSLFVFDLDTPLKFPGSLDNCDYATPFQPYNPFDVCSASKHMEESSQVHLHSAEQDPEQ